MQTFELTKRALSDMRQLNISQRLVEFILKKADSKFQTELGGCVLAISHKRLEKIERTTSVDRKLLERAKDIELVTSGSNVVTVRERVFGFTDNALKRMEDIGISRLEIAFIFEHADEKKEAKKKCRVWSISKEKLQEMKQTGDYPAQLLDSSENIGVTISPTDDAVITVMQLDLRFSEHAIVRSQQRGISKEAAELVLEHGDRKARVGGGDVALTISKKQLEALKREGKCTPQMIDKIKNIGLVISQATNQVITAMQLSEGRGSRRYRRTL